MINNKNLTLINQFEEYIKNNDIDTIKDQLPKLLKTFTKTATRMDKILKQSDSQQLEVLKLTEKLEDTNSKVNTLLNNASQGFLYLDENMKIGPEYSKVVYTIFQEDVTHKDITTLLYYNDKDDALFLKETLKSILQEIPMTQEILISLLKKEFIINEKFVEVEYKVLNDKNFMIILTDITAKKILAEKIKDEQQILKMVIEIVTTKEQFQEVKHDYELFIEKIDQFKYLDKLPALRRETHTYKGLFAQKEMLHIVKKLHDFETTIDDNLKNNIIDETILNVTKKDMQDWLELDLAIVKDILGADYFSKSNYIEINKYRIEQLHLKILEYFNTKKETIINDVSSDITNLKYNNIKIFFRPYEKLVEQLAHQLDKYINPLVLDIENIYLPDNYLPFINSLVHIFRNSVDHGIETLEDRYTNEKDEYGTITCNIKQQNGLLKIEISDDGVGIDTKKIKSLAVKKGIYTQEEVNNMSEDKAVLIIFEDSFSTSENITNISGRGVGLASIAEELNQLNGTMEVENNFGHGIKFKFNLPI